MSVAAPPRPTLPPEPEALFEEARQHRRARRLRLTLAALIVAGGAGGGAYWGFGGGSAHTASLPQIEASASRARVSSQRMILQETTRRQAQPFSGRTELWTDLLTGNTRSVDFGKRSRPVMAFATEVAKDKRQPTVADILRTVVAYNSHSATQTNMHMPLAIARWGTRIADPFATNLRFRVLGTETVDGQDTYHLRAEYPTRPAQVGVHAPTQEDVWISTSDHRLVRVQSSNDATVFATNDFRWLPRNSATLAKVRLAIPAGFTHELRLAISALPATPPTPPSQPEQIATDNGISVTAGANGVIIFDTADANQVVRKVFADRSTNYTCFKVNTSGQLSRVVTGERSGAFAPRVAFELTTSAPFDGCHLSADYGRRWPLKFGGHEPVELAFTAAGRRYFADRAAANELADFVRSRKIHEIRRESPPAIARSLRATYKHLVIELPSPTAPVRPGLIGYSVTSDGVIFSNRSTTGSRFSVEIAHGRIANQNVKPLAYVF